MNMQKRWIASVCAVILIACGSAVVALNGKDGKNATDTATKGKPHKEAPWKPQIVKTENEWKKILTPQRFYILRQKGTEPAFMGEYAHSTGKGIYVCAACDNGLFKSETKFDSGTGWPSFYAPLSKTSVHTEVDKSFGDTRTEVLCNRCGGHLGHVFTDGPPPTGLRYCMNSPALKFIKKP